MLVELRIIDQVSGAPQRPGRIIELASERISAREIVRRRVEAEVAEYNSGMVEVFSGLVQPKDTEAVLNGYKLRKRRPLDAREQAETAIAALESGRVILLFDHRQVTDLDAPLTVSAGSEARFVKLVPLIGG